ncbi:MAG TPA: hypothetical protein VI818_08720, partial [Candidatus Thermoplasmatota archaeon]|nr:hypothetical protein [Candidatus Thermoplasmatota archaeon]
LGPRSLRVGSATLGEYLRLSINLTGHTKRFEFNGGDFTETVEPFEDHRYLERSIVGNATIADAFLRPTAALVIEARATDLDPEDAVLASYNVTTVRELATKRIIYSELPRVSRSCINGQCETSLTLARLYPRVMDENEDADWGSLEGRVLNLGQTLSFNRTFKYFSGPGETSSATHWLNFTPIREAELNGERVFVVQPSSKFVLSDPSTQPSPQATAPATKNPKPPPKTSHLLWIGSRAPVPLKEEIKSPFEHEGAWYWQNTTRRLDVFEPGSAIVPWGAGEAQPLLDRRPDAVVVPGKDFFTTKAAGLIHPLSNAWNAIQTDPTLVSYQTYKAQHPGAVPFSGTYYADPGNRAYTWQFWVDDGKNSILAVESRFQGVASNDVGVVQNRMPNSRVSCTCGQPSPDQMAQGDLVAVEDATKAARSVWHTATEPGARYMVTVSALDGKLAGSFHLFNAEKRNLGGGPFGVLTTVAFWRNTDSVTVSLRDGGILGLNGTFASGIHEWPWLFSAGSPIRAAEEAHAAIPWWGLGPVPVRPLDDDPGETQNG